MMSISPDVKNKKIGCVIMASGLGMRFGGDKLMADFGGKPMVNWILESAIACFESVIVVTRNTGVVELCKSRNVQVVYHDYPYRSDTIRLGISNLDATVDGVVFCLADQPFLSVSTLQRIIEVATGKPDKIWRSICKESIGSPTYFPKKYFNELSSLPQDKGGSFVCKNHQEDVEIVEIQNSLELLDIDTKETYDELLPIASSLGIWNEYLLSGKKHLFITGYRGAGKTTLINNMRPLIGNGTSGLTSFVVKGVDVRLVNDRTKEEIVIGKYIPSDDIKDNKMTPDLSVFDTRGVSFINELIASDSTWVTIDEIGYLEEFSINYQNSLRRLLDDKRVIAVIRKDDLKFLTELINRNDSYVIDLNDSCE